MSDARPPSDTMFAAVFAAPPRTGLDAFTFSTGTGASGEIRLHSPIRYSSRMASPRTRTRLRAKSETRAAMGSAGSLRVIGVISVDGIGPLESANEVERPDGRGNPERVGVPRLQPRQRRSTQRMMRRFVGAGSGRP